MHMDLQWLINTASIPIWQEYQWIWILRNMSELSTLIEIRDAGWIPSYVCERKLQAIK